MGCKFVFGYQETMELGGCGSGFTPKQCFIMTFDPHIGPPATFGNECAFLGKDEPVSSIKWGVEAFYFLLDYANK